MEKQTKRRVRGIAAAAVIVAIFAIAGVLKIPSGIGETPSAVVLAYLGSDEHVFVDNELVTTKRTPGGRLVYVAPGQRDILIAKEGYWPWLKQVSVGKGEAVQLSPFFFLRKPSYEEVGGDDPEHDVLLARSEHASIPETPGVLVSESKEVTVWKAGNALEARWTGSGNPSGAFCTPNCRNEITFLPRATEVTELAFMHDRSDVVILATAHKVYALELDGRPIQNLQLVYEGEGKVHFTIVSDGSLYVSDGGRLFHLKTEE
jgi:hypothetical protein